MLNNKSVLACCGAVILGVLIATAGNAASTLERTQSLTFSQPVALPGVTLPAGTYIFERAAPQTSLDIVRVTTGDRKRVMFMGFTRIVDRPRGLDKDHVVTFGEARAGAPQPIAAWYPSGLSRGHSFIYR